jgi:hypothetical protein
VAERATGKLKALELPSLLVLLRAYLESDAAVILTRVGDPDCCGNPVHLDGRAFLAGFVKFLADQGLDAEKSVADLCLVMELSGYVHSGGTRAMAYRLETGCSKITPDYFDVIAGELCYQLADGELVQVRQPPDAFLFQRLKDIAEEDELCVRSSIQEIDQILLALARKLEDYSCRSLGEKDGGGQASA